MGSADKIIEKPMKEGQDTVWFDEPSFPREKNTQEVQPPEGEVWHEHTKQVVGPRQKTALRPPTSANFCLFYVKRAVVPPPILLNFITVK